MTLLQALVHTPFAGALGWAIFHSLWEGTVAGPRLHKTVRISSSASVGRGCGSAIYEDITTMVFVCQLPADYSFSSAIVAPAPPSPCDAG